MTVKHLYVNYFIWRWLHTLLLPLPIVISIVIRICLWFVCITYDLVHLHENLKHLNSHSLWIFNEKTIRNLYNLKTIQTTWLAQCLFPITIHYIITVMWSTNVTIIHNQCVLQETISLNPKPRCIQELFADLQLLL